MSFFDWIRVTKTPPLLSMTQRFWLGTALIFSVSYNTYPLIKLVSVMPALIALCIAVVLIFAVLIAFQRSIGEFSFGVNAMDFSSIMSKAYLMRYFLILVVAANVSEYLSVLTSLIVTPILICALGYLFEKFFGQKFVPDALQPTEGNFPFGVNK
jgi:hypothetical protein